MITVVARQTVKPGREAELRALMADLTAKVKGGEPGCATFDWVRDRSDARTCVVIEQYVDQAASTCISARRTSNRACRIS